MMNPLRTSTLVLSLTAGMLLVACGDAPEEDAAPAETPEAPATPPAEEAAGSSATADLQPTEGNEAEGRVTFTEVDGGVRIVADVQGLAEGPHGFHVHETGDCSAPDGTSAGGHFAPEGSPHGAPDAPAAERHAGDLGNLEVGADGTARYERVDSVLTLSGPSSVVGRAVIVHGGADDLESQPSGDAGPRVACGVVQSGGG